MDSFEERLDQIFMEGRWEDFKALGKGALLGGALGVGAGMAVNGNLQKNVNPVQQQVDVHKEYPRVLKKVDDKEPYDIEKPSFPISDNEIKIVASTLILEAGGETEKNAMTAVMNVIHNRAGGDPKRYRDVVLKPLQFSCHNGKKPEQSISRSVKHPKWEEAIKIVQDSIKGNLTDVTGGSTHYHVFQGPSECKPSWTHPKLGGKKYIDGKSRAIVITKYIGDHVFLKDVNKVLAKK